MQEIRLGTIGSGNIVRWVLNNVAKIDGIRLVAVYSRTEEKGNKLARDYGVEKVYTDMDAFLRDQDVNFVYVATPNSLHYEQTKKALLAGKNVICEKPFCTKLEQAREIAALAKERGLILIDAVPPAFMPNLAVLKREIPKLGRVRLVMSNFSQYSSRYDSLMAGGLPNIFNPAYGGGCLMDINFYNIYLNVALFGMPRAVCYHPNLYQNMVDTSGVAVLEYDGFVSQAVGAKDTWGINFFQIEGEQGYIYVRDGSASLTEVRVVTKAGEEVFNEQTNPDRWYYEVREIVRIVRENDRAELDRRLEVMLNVVDTLERARKSAGIRFPEDLLPENSPDSDWL